MSAVFLFIHMRPPLYPKKPDISEKLFYHYKISPSIYVLFDSDMNTPLAYGSFNFVGSVISELPKSSTIFYYEADGREGWKMKRSYKPNKESVDSQKTAQRVEQKKEDGNKGV